MPLRTQDISIHLDKDSVPPTMIIYVWVKPILGPYSQHFIFIVTYDSAK
jgi:hypothetical protein